MRPGQVPPLLRDYLRVDLEGVLANDLRYLSARFLLEYLQIDFAAQTISADLGHDGTLRVRGGSGVIVEALLRRIPGQRRKLQHRLLKLQRKNGRLQLTMQTPTGTRHVFADRVVLTTPIHAFRHIDIRLPAFQRYYERPAWSAGYGNVLSVTLFFAKKIWREHGFSGRLMLDSGIEIWDSFDNVHPTQGALRLYIVGDQARRLGGLSPKDLYGQFIAELMNRLDQPELWPGLKRHFNGFAVTDFPYAYSGSDLRAEDLNHYSLPVQFGRLYMAGDHFDQHDQGYLNGALKSALRAVQRIEHDQVKGRDCERYLIGYAEYP